MSEENTPVRSRAELIETRRFLGREFLTFLWFQSLVFEKFDVGTLGQVTLHFDKTMTLETSRDDVGGFKEKSTLLSPEPTYAREAVEALRQGKLLTRCKLTMTRGEQTFTFGLDADTLGISSAKLPPIVADVGEDAIYERIGLLEDLEASVETIFYQFLELRLSPSWNGLVRPALYAWIHADESEDFHALGAVAKYVESEAARGHRQVAEA